MTSYEMQQRYYERDARDSYAGAHYAIMDRHGRSMDGAPITIAIGLYPREAQYVARALNEGKITPNRHLDESLHERGRRLWTEAAAAFNVFQQMSVPQVRA